MKRVVNLGKESCWCVGGREGRWGLISVNFVYKCQVILHLAQDDRCAPGASRRRDLRISALEDQPFGLRGALRLRQQTSAEDPGGIPPSVGSLREIPRGKLRDKLSMEGPALRASRTTEFEERPDGLEERFA